MATVIEYFVWQTTTLATGVFVVFSILFFANLVLYLVSMLSLSDQVLTTVLLSVSCAAQALVGLAYLRARAVPAPS